MKTLISTVQNLIVNEPGSSAPEGVSSAGAVMSQNPLAFFCSTVVRLVALQVLERDKQSQINRVGGDLRTGSLAFTGSRDAKRPAKLLGLYIRQLSGFAHCLHMFENRLSTGPRIRQQVALMAYFVRNKTFFNFNIYWNNDWSSYTLSLCPALSTPGSGSGGICTPVTLYLNKLYIHLESLYQAALLVVITKQQTSQSGEHAVASALRLVHQVPGGAASSQSN
ncbi:Protein unc-80 homolog [Eumeta japonica]|uniref:Protein unc-80 homolog n=1 Tax=Eumeta variegata TaxID=151549 RepID=A0A4C1SVC0_EUMVA|nr:Protein unc-80 homolog [Eumeta japonica]